MASRKISVKSKRSVVAWGKSNRSVNHYSADFRRPRSSWSAFQRQYVKDDSISPMNAANNHQLDSHNFWAILWFVMSWICKNCWFAGTGKADWELYLWHWIEDWGALMTKDLGEQIGLGSFWLRPARVQRVQQTIGQSDNKKSGVQIASN